MGPGSETERRATSNQSGRIHQPRRRAYSGSLARDHYSSRGELSLKLEGRRRVLGVQCSLGRRLQTNNSSREEEVARGGLSRIQVSGCCAAPRRRFGLPRQARRPRHNKELDPALQDLMSASAWGCLFPSIRPLTNELAPSSPRADYYTWRDLGSPPSNLYHTRVSLPTRHTIISP